MLFKEIIGQEEVKEKLIQTVKENRVSHAQSFFGPEGVGKLPLAIAYAQYIACENKKDDDSCGVCSSCIKYNKLIHPDLHFLFPIATTKSITKTKDVSCFSSVFLNEFREAFSQNNYLTLNDWYNQIGIENKQAIINAEDCNEIIKTLNLKTYESEFKVVIIWMVEKLFHSAAPKLLKILEEPPEKTLFILISENPDQIIKTILSRTQMVKVPRIYEEVLRDTIKEKFNLSQSQVNYVNHLAQGSYSEAVNIINESGKENDDFAVFSKWMRSCYTMDFVTLSDWIEDISKVGREKQKLFFSYALHIIRECMQYSCLGKELTNLDSNEAEFAVKFAPYINSKNCIKISEELNTAVFHIERNANPKILFMDLSIKIGQLLKM